MSPMTAMTHVSAAPDLATAPPLCRRALTVTRGRRSRRIGWSVPTLAACIAAIFFWPFFWPADVTAQAGRESGAGRGPAAAKTTAKVTAPIDLTGYWVAVVTQDWRWRMVTPAKGDYASVPLTLDAKQVADAWDPARDAATGDQCKAYGAPAIMAVPTRLRIAWRDDNTLTVETDAGTQTRVFHFGAWTPRPGPATWQGDSTAVWQQPRAARGTVPRGGSLQVVTRHLRPGYLRKNGVPYSAAAVLTEYWDLSTDRNGDRWITITSTVEDAKYLREPMVTALNFKQERDGAKWEPTPCSVR
jgi:hypothetical protein